MEKPLSLGASCSVTILFAGGVLFSIIAFATLARLIFGEGISQFHFLVLAASFIEIAIARHLFVATLNEIDGSKPEAFWIAMGLICLLIVGCLSVSTLQTLNSVTEQFSISVLFETTSRSALLFLLFAVWFAFPLWTKRHTFPSAIRTIGRPKPHFKHHSVYEAVFLT